MQTLAETGLVGGGEGLDHAFAPDICLKDGASVTGPWGHLTAIHTPGHLGNHMSFVWRDMVFCGDHVMGWASSLVSPPDGDLTDFMRSCHRLRAVQADLFLPGHGAPILHPQERLDWLIAHRLSREAEILAQLTTAPATPAELTDAIYTDVPKQLRLAAQRNVLAHLVDLHGRGIVGALPQLAQSAKFHLL